MQTRHDVVQPEKEDLAVPELQKNRRIGIDADVDFGHPFEVLDDEKGHAHGTVASCSHEEKKPLPPPDGRYGKGHAEAAGEEDGGVDRAEEVFSAAAALWKSCGYSYR